MLTLAIRRLNIGESGLIPKVGLLFHPYFGKVNKQEVSDTIGPSIFDRIDITPSYRQVKTAANTRAWHRISHSKV